jgi:amphi-Trp domain-containing protein
LEDLVTSLKEGTICVQKGEEVAVLTPTDQVALEIKAAEKKDKFKFELEITWRQGPEAVESDQPLSISSEAPPEPEPAEESTAEGEQGPEGSEQNC